MNTFVNKVGLGQSIKYGEYLCDVIAIHKYEPYNYNVLLGFHTYSDSPGAWELNPLTLQKTLTSYDVVNNLEYYQYAYWIGSSSTVELVHSPERIFLPDQKCVGCSLPAPHTKPNTSENTFVCTSCSILSDIGALALPGTAG